MSDIDRKKYIDKLKKCLALSKSPEAHEAAAALRQAQKLMSMLGVDEKDLEVELQEIKDALVKTREGFGRCHVMQKLGGMLMSIFGVHAVTERNPGSADRLNMRYIGPVARVALAEYAHRVIVRSMDEAWAKFLAEQPWRKQQSGARTAFRVGYLNAIWQKVEKLAISPAEETAILRYKDNLYGVILEKNKDAKRNIDMRIAGAGFAAGKEFEINRPVGQENLKLEAK